MPSVGELRERLAQRDGLIEALSAELGAARVRIAELETRLGGRRRTVTSAEAPEGVTVVVAYGPRIIAIIPYL